MTNTQYIFLMGLILFATDSILEHDDTTSRGIVVVWFFIGVIHTIFFKDK